MRTINSSLRQSTPDALTRKSGSNAHCKASLKHKCRRRFRAQAKQQLLGDAASAYERELEAQRAQRDQELWEETRLTEQTNDLAVPLRLVIRTSSGLVLASVAKGRLAA